MKRPSPPPPPVEPPPVTKPAQPRPKPPTPTPTPAPAAKANPADGCRLLALQRAADAKSLGRNAEAQIAVRNETYADCMSGKGMQ